MDSTKNWVEKRENPDQNISDEATAADMARVFALKTALLIESRIEHECEVPNWYDSCPLLLNQRISAR